MLSTFSYAVRRNLVLDSIPDAVSELKLFHQAAASTSAAGGGGGTICDVTTVGIRYKPEALPQISRESGVHVVMGTGYYVGAYLPEDVKLMSTHEVSKKLTLVLTIFPHSDFQCCTSKAGGPRKPYMSISAQFVNILILLTIQL